MLQPSFLRPVAPIIRWLAVLLLALLVVLAMLSADEAARLGLAGLRMPAFIGVTVALVGLALACRPVIDPDDVRIPALLLLLVAAMAIVDLQGPIDPIDYKLLLPVLVLLTAGPIAAVLQPLDLPRLLWRLLTGYVVVTAMIVWQSDPAELTRGTDGITRIDASGSLVSHTLFCLLHLVLSWTTWRRSGLVGRVLRLSSAILAGGMLLAAATRTPFITLSVASMLMVAVARDRRVWLTRIVLSVAGGLTVLTLFTVLIDDSLWRRIQSDGQPEWTTGRMVAVEAWLERAGDHPFGMGLGTVRDALADGKPALDGDAILDWPHNEAVRLWVEAGPFGLAFLAVLLGSLALRAGHVARHHQDDAARALAITLLADAIAQSLFQNWLNGVYVATLGVLTINLLYHLPWIVPFHRTTRLTASALPA